MCWLLNTFQTPTQKVCDVEGSILVAVEEVNAIEQ
jgi:hypothetical protein